MWIPRTGFALLLLALGCAAARSDDSRKPSDDPDPGFLEFLGSVDRLADVDPHYLSPAGVPQPGGPPGKPMPPPPPPRIPAQPLPPSASVDPGGHNE
jgi:hypothetical protein